MQFCDACGEGEGRAKRVERRAYERGRCEGCSPSPPCASTRNEVPHPLVTQPDGRSVHELPLPMRPALPREAEPPTSHDMRSAVHIATRVAPSPAGTTISVRVPACRLP